MNRSRSAMIHSLALLVAALGAQRVSAQVVVVQPPGPAVSYRIVSPYQTRGGVPYGRRSVLPGFSRRGGVGTTPFLGNSYGLGAYGYNYDATRRGRGWTNRRVWRNRIR